MTRITGAPPEPPKDQLILVTTLRAKQIDSQHLVLTRKFLDGVAEYARLWPGSVTLLIERSDVADTNLDPVAVDVRTLTFGVEFLPANKATLRQRLNQRCVVLATLADENLHFVGSCRLAGAVLVWVTEASLTTRHQIIDAEQRINALRRFKRKLTASISEMRYRQAIRCASGVQANGMPTYEAYSQINRNTLLFFDTRIRDDMLATDADILARSLALLAGAPLRLVFSGRLVSIKGVDYLPLLGRELMRREVPFSLDIFGGGDREPYLHAAIEALGVRDRVRLNGVLDFETELVPRIRNTTDVFVCCHVQGDPACTYLETLSCGVPIVGFDNEAWRGLSARAPLGWNTPTGDVGLLADAIACLHRDRDRLVTAAFDARNFAREHTFPRTMQARVEQLWLLASQ